MDAFPDVDMPHLCRWLCTKCEEHGGDGTGAEVIIQLLQSSLGPTLLSVVSVRLALISMMETDNVHIGLCNNQDLYRHCKGVFAHTVVRTRLSLQPTI